MDLSSWVRRAALGLGLALSVVVVACGDDDASSGGSSKSALFDELCSATDTCCQASGKTNDHASCVAFYTAFSADQTYDEAKGKACLELVKKARAEGSFCNSGLSSAKDDSGENPCDEVFADESSGAGGTKKPGEPCSADSDCMKVEGATDAYCTTSTTFGPDGTSTTSKYCEVEITLKVGDACGNDEKGYNRNCNSDKDESCDFTTSKCTGPKAEGETCFGSKSCADGLYCPSSGSTSVCTKTLAAGSACGGSADACDDSTYCDQETAKCVAKLGDKSSCTTNQSCSSGSCVNGVCEKGSSGNSICFSKN